MRNLLIKGDNLSALKMLRDDLKLRNKIDLVYIDPPFATGGSFSIDSSGRTATISKSGKGIIAYTDTLKGEEFIDFLRQRIEVIYDLLSAQGSLYLHIDYKIGHYVKVMLDGVFGTDMFRNDITRIKCNPKNFSRVGYGNIKDMILFYTKTRTPIWHEPRIRIAKEDIERLYPKIDKFGKRYTTVPIHAPGETQRGESARPFKGVYPPQGRHWRCSVEELERLDSAGLIEWSATGNPRKINYADDHATKKMQDIWDFKDPAYPTYPTEKNKEMLKTIIEASSDESSIVLDCFAGSGGTLVTAAQLGRKWIGVDVSDAAISTIRKNFDVAGGIFPDRKEYDFIEIIR